MAFNIGKRKSKAGMSNVASLHRDNPDAALRIMEAESNEEDDDERRIKGNIFKMIDQGTASITDLWAPPRMKILYDHIELGEECLAVLTVSNWPKSLSYGWLNDILNSEQLTGVKMDVSMHIHPIRREYASAYMADKFRSAASSADAEYEKGKVKKENQQIYSKQMDTASMLAQMLDSGHENLFQVSLVLGIYGEKQWELDEDGEEVLYETAEQDLIRKERLVRKVLSETSRGGFAVKALLHQQRDGVKSLSPWGYGGLHNNQNFYTSALATCFPFTQGTLQVDDGILYGVSRTTGQPIFFNIFNRDWMNSFNCLIIGTKGSGKSATAKTLLGRYALAGTQIFIIDPAVTTKGEYTNLATSLNGTVVDFGGSDGVFINPFELSSPEKHPKNPKDSIELARTIYQAKKNYLSGLLDIMRTTYIEENSVTTETEAFGRVENVLIDRLYQFKGINTTTNRWDFSQWTRERMPSMNDFFELVCEYEKIVRGFNNRDKVISWGKHHLTQQGQLYSKNSDSERIMFGYYRYIANGSPLWGEAELIAIKQLKNILMEYVNDDKHDVNSEKAILFSGTREADLSNQCVVFRFGQVADKIKGLATYMAFELIYSRITSSDMSRGYKNKIVVLDEAWKMIKDGSSRKYMETLYREGRKTNTGIWLISQSYEDFHGAENDVFFKYAETKIIMSIPGVEVDQLQSDIELSPSMASLINSDTNKMQAGSGIINLSGTRKETVAFYCTMTPMESKISDTSDSNQPPYSPAELVGAEKAEEYGLL